MDTATRDQQCSSEPVLFMAMELSASKWKLGFTVGLGQKPRERTIDAGDLEALSEAVARAKRRFRLAEDAGVVSCYEAGRDGFWIDRYLRGHGIGNVVIDPASVEGNRRRKKRKTDRLDLGKLLRCLVRWHRGEEKVWAVVRPPSEEAEDARQFHRELEVLKGERTRHVARIKSLLVSQGIQVKRVGKDFVMELEAARMWDGSPVPPQLRDRLARELARLQVLREQICELEGQRREAIRKVKDRRMEQIRHLMRLRGVGENGAWLLVMELFGWREFRNRGEVGSIAGLTPTPWASGDEDREQGIDKAGNRRVRAMMIELAWCWLRYQPRSELSIWFEQRFGGGGKRSRRIGIVALARRLLVALWHFLRDGWVPKGAVLTAPG